MQRRRPRRIPKTVAQRSVVLFSFNSLLAKGNRVKNLFQSNTVEEVISRIDRLQASSPRQWGKMDVAQMLAHCSTTMEMASGKLVAKRTLLGRLVGPRVRHLLRNDKPMPRNSPTSKELKVVNARDFERERQRLLESVRQFHSGGEAQCTRHPHPFFGPLTPEEWSTGMYKHLDHHLRQFGV